MAKSKVSVNRKKRIGRPPVGAVLVGVRVPPDELALLDDWVAKQDDAPSRPEAIRRLLVRGLKSEKSASDLAGEMIDDLADPNATTAEKRSRKHTLMKGPEEFRGQRADEAKRRK
jgi:hypothetical protein